MSDAPEIAALLAEHGMWTHRGTTWTCRCGETLGRFNDPVTSKSIEPLPLWHAHLDGVLEAHTADRLRAALRAESLLSGLPTSSEGGANLSPGGTAVSQDIDSKLDGFASGLGDVREVGEVVGGEVVIAHSPPEAEELAVEFLSVGGGCSVGCHASSVLDVNPLCQEVLTRRERAAAEKALRDAADEWEQEDTDAAGDWLRDRADTYRRTDKEADR